MGLRYNPPPGWPPPPRGFTPKPGWEPDPSWPPPPPGWQLWVNDDEPPAQAWAGPAPGWAAEPTPDGRGYRRSSTGTTSGWAVASFILGIFAVVPLSAIFGFVALQKIRRLGQRGKGLAIAGLILSLAWVAVLVAVSVISNDTATRRSSTGQITHSGDLGVFALATGDCFDNPKDTQDIESVTAIPCTQAHDSQVFAKFDLSGGDDSYPAPDALNKMADTGCNSRTGSIDKSKTTADMTIRVLFPDQHAWADGRRTVSCLVVNPAPTLTTSLLTS